MDEAPQDLLAAALSEHPELLDAARRIFEYTGFLLDDDEKLTKTGALNGKARELLRARILELVDPVGAAAPTTEVVEDEGEAGAP